MISRCFLILAIFKSISIISENVANSSKKAYVYKPSILPESIVVNVNGSNNKIYFLSSDLNNLSKTNNNTDHKDEIESDGTNDKSDEPTNNDDEKCSTPYSVMDGVYSDCRVAVRKNNGKEGIYKIQKKDSKLAPFEVHCFPDEIAAIPAWTTIQLRVNGCINFFRNWSTYESGFGPVNGEQFLGLEKISAITHNEHYTLWIKLVDWNNETKDAFYKYFSVGDVKQNYMLKVDGYEGEAGNALEDNFLIKFSTYDRDNDKNSDLNCAAKYKTGWWFRDCEEEFSNLNGNYFENNSHGITWHTWHGMDYSFPYVRMAIREGR